MRRKEVMPEVLLYVRDQDARSGRLTSDSPVVGDLRPGDSVWVVTSGKSLGRDEKRAGFLVAIGKVAGVVESTVDDRPPVRAEGRYRIVLDNSGSHEFDPVPVDHLLRPEGRDAAIPIGRFVSVPRRLNESLVRKLRAAAGPELALRWLTGTRR
jgi:hypothetical protein